MKSGKIIQLLRTAEGISQFELAGRLGISRAYLSQVENNHKQPSISFLKKVSENFKVPLILLIKNEDDIDYGLNDELKKILSDVLSAKISIINKTK